MSGCTGGCKKEPRKAAYEPIWLVQERQATRQSSSDPNLSHPKRSLESLLA